MSVSLGGPELFSPAAGEVLPRIKRAMGIVLRAYQDGEPLVRIHPLDFNAEAEYRLPGQTRRYVFDPAAPHLSPDTAAFEQALEQIQATGFSETEIRSGLSHMTTYIGPEIAGRLSINGLLDDQTASRTVRERTDGQFEPSKLDFAESSVIEHAAFLTQLAHHTAIVYEATDAEEAVAALRQDLLSGSPELNEAALDELLGLSGTTPDPSRIQEPSGVILGPRTMAHAVRGLWKAPPAGKTSLRAVLESGEYYARTVHSLGENSGH